MTVAWTLQTGFGSWNPLLWLAAFLSACAIALAIRALGRKDYRKDSGQAKPFVSGNDVPEGAGHIPASNLYWGFLESLKGYYEKLVPLHTGNAGDYLLWLMGVLALVVIVGLAV